MPNAKNIQKSLDHNIYDINNLKTKIFEAVTQEVDFESWFDGLAPEKQIQVESKFALLNSYLTKKLYSKEIITATQSDKIINHIANQAFKISSNTNSKNPKTKYEHQILQGLKNSAKEIMEIHNHFVGLSWIQMAHAKNYDFKNLTQEIGLKYDQSQIEILSKAEGFLPGLINFGLYGGVEIERPSKEEVHSILSHIFGTKLVEKAFINAKRQGEKNKNEVFWQIVNLVAKNHPKKLVLTAVLTFAESSISAIALNNLVNSLNENDLDSALFSVLALVLANCGSILSSYTQSKIDIWMDNGPKDKTADFNGLGALLIDIIERDPFFAQIYAQNHSSVELKNLIDEIKPKYFEIYNLVFKEGLTAVFSILGSAFTAMKLMSNSPATILPPLIAVCVNYIAQEIKNQKNLPLESARIAISAKIEDLFQSLVTEISQRIEIRDTQVVFKEIMPQISILKEKLLNSVYTVHFIERIDSSAPAYALMSILGMKSNNTALQSMFGSDPRSVFGLSMVQSSLAHSVTRLISVVKRLEFAQDVVNSDFLTKLHDPAIKQAVAPDTSIVLSDLVLFKNRSNQPINIRISQGEKIQITGSNGSGKSSLVTLLANQTPKQAYLLGDILVGGTPLYLINPKKYQQTIAKMPQTIQVFNDTIGVNICGKDQLDPEMFDLFVRSPLAKNLYEKYSDQTKGNLDYLSLGFWWSKNLSIFKLGDLSGGEKKMLGILRVKAKLLQNPNQVKIVLLDEPLANLSFKNNSESTSGAEEVSIHDWMQKVILSMMRDYPLVTFIYIDHSGDQKNTLSAQIKAETGLSERSKVLRLA